MSSCCGPPAASSRSPYSACGCARDAALTLIAPASTLRAALRCWRCSVRALDPALAAPAARPPVGRLSALALLASTPPPLGMPSVQTGPPARNGHEPATGVTGVTGEARVAATTRAEPCCCPYSTTANRSAGSSLARRSTARGRCCAATAGSRGRRCRPVHAVRWSGARANSARWSQRRRRCRAASLCRCVDPLRLSLRVVSNPRHRAAVDGIPPGRMMPSPRSWTWDRLDGP